MMGGMTGKRKVLSVDDNPVNLRLLEGILEKDYEALSVSNGVDALDLCAKEPVDLVLLDIVMPEMDGYEVCKRLKSNLSTKHIPVIFLSAKNEINDIVKGFEVGGVDYVKKPFNKIELLARVKTHVELKTLKGIVPICMHCKEIRDDEGFWNQLERYITEHSEAQFSHSICDKCFNKYYPED